jgi:hypothetical protein
MIVMRRMCTSELLSFPGIPGRRRTAGLVSVGVCAGRRRVASMLPLAGEKAENEKCVESEVSSPAGDDA